MQGAFWKTVGIVGVVGIGSMTVLSLHNEMQKRKTPVAAADGTPLQTGGGDQTVNADIPVSDFEKMLAASQSETPVFQQSEPTLTPDASTPKPVDTTVRDSALSDMQNPFGGFEGLEEPQPPEATMVAAAFQPSADPTTIENTSFDPDAAFASADEKTFPKDIPTDDQPSPGFVLFNPDETPERAAATPEQAAPQTAAATNPMQFFGADSQAPDPTIPDNGSPFYEDGPNPEPMNPPRGNPIADPLDNGSLGFAPFPGDQPPISPVSSPEPQRQESNPQSFPPIDNSRSPFGNDLTTPDPVQPRMTDDRIEFAPTPNNDRSFDPPAFNNRRQPEPAQPNFNDLRDTGMPPAFDRFDERPELNDFGTDRDFTPEPNAGFEPLRPIADDSNQPFEEDEEPVLLPTPEDFRQPIERPTPIEDRDFRDERSFGPEPDRRVPDLRMPDLPDNTREPIDNRITIPDSRFDSNNRRDEPIDIRQPTERNPRGNSGDPWDLDFDRRDNTTAPERSLDDRRLEDTIRPVSGNRHPNLVLQKSAPKNATVGVPLKYSIIVTNRGDATAYNVTVDDQIPPGAKVNAARPVAQEDRANKKMFWKFDQIEPGDSQEIVVQMTPTGEGTIDGVASVRFNAQVRATTVITAPALQLQMIGPNQPVRIGEQVRYRYIIENTGSGMATDVVLRTELPLNGGLTHPQGNDLEYEIGNLPPNDRREVALSVVAAEAGEHTANARVTANGGAEDVRGHRVNIIGAQLQIIRRGPQNRYVGRTAVFENMITNETSMDAMDARVVETVPEGMKFVQAGQGGRYNPTTRTVTWEIRRLEANREMSLKVELMPMQAGAPRSVVTIFENAGMQGREQVSTIQVEDLHNLSASLSQPPGPIAIGEEFGFKITVDNKGTADATDVQVAVAVPPELEVIGVRENGIQLGADINRTNNVVRFDVIRRVEPTNNQVVELRLRGKRTATNAIVKAKVTYKQMRDSLEVSRAVTVFDERL